MGFKERLKEQRINKGFKQRELADKIKSSNTSISNWEAGRSQPSAGVVLLLSEALGVEPLVLLGEYSHQDIQDLDKRPVAELSYEDKLALKLTKDSLREIGNAVAVGINKKLMGNGGEQLLLSYHCLNHSGKILMIDYLIGLLRVPSYIDQFEALGIEQKQIDDLLELKGILAAPPEQRETAE